MEAKKYHLILGVITGILCAAALGQIESPRPDEPILVAPANPALAGIKQLDVVIAIRCADPNRISLDSKSLKAEVERRLDKAGIKIFVPKEGVSYKPVISSDLKVSIEVLNLPDSQQCVFRIQTLLSRPVRLDEQSGWLFKADVWTTEPVMQTGLLQDISGKVSEAALAQVDAFIQAYHITNSAGTRLSDANATLPKGLSEIPLVKSAVEYKYVASKNSEVFHTSNCRLAKRILPENMTGYSSKEEAINAGKRPCKICKP